MKAIDRQHIEQACAKVITLFSNYNDRQDYQSLSDLFTEDGSFARPTDPDNYVHGRANILAAFQARPKDRITRHVISNIIIDVIDDKSAKGVCYATLFHAPADASPATFGVQANPSQLIGEFYIDLALTDDGWKIAKQTGKIVFTT